ncbi:unnamed protein product, partial [Ectocarpus sp. 12 AP-2014]
TTATVAAGAGGSREEAMVLELPEDNGQMVCVLLQTLSQSFMANPAAAQGLSAALAPPASTANVGGGGGGGAASGTRRGAGGSSGGSGPPRDGAASQHTVSVSLGKAWLEILVKLMRRASEDGVAVAGGDGRGGIGGRGGGATGTAVVRDALEDPSTRDAL